MELLLREHLNEYNVQISKLQDEICSIKKHISLLDSHTRDSAVSLGERATQMCTDVSILSDNVNRKLQSVVDMLKNIKKSNTRVDNKTPEKSVPKTQNINFPSESTRMATCFNNDSELIELTQPESSSQSDVHHGSQMTPQQENNRETARPVSAMLSSSPASTQGVPARNLSQSAEASHSNRQYLGETSHISAKSKRHSKTLLLGDSILKGINKRGLSYQTDIKSQSGAKLLDISSELRHLNFSEYSEVILYVGGNDISSKNPQTLYTEMSRTVSFLKERNIIVKICTLCPRINLDGVPTNDAYLQLSQDMQIKLIDVYSSFVFSNGQVATSYYAYDKIHLNNKGSSKLVRCINGHVPITRSGQQSTSWDRPSPIVSTPPRGRISHHKSHQISRPRRDWIKYYPSQRVNSPHGRLKPLYPSNPMSSPLGYYPTPRSPRQIEFATAGDLTMQRLDVSQASKFQQHR